MKTEKNALKKQNKETMFNDKTTQLEFKERYFSILEEMITLDFEEKEEDDDWYN